MENGQENVTQEVTQQEVAQEQIQDTPQVEVEEFKITPELVEEVLNQIKTKVKVSGKSMAKEKGLKGQDASKLLDEVNEQLTNTKKVSELEEKINTLLKENETTKAAAKQEALDLSIEMVTKNLNLDDNVKELIIKNSNFDDAFNDKGKVDKEVVAKKFNDFLEKYPTLRPTKEVENPYKVRVGSGQSSDDGAKNEIKFNFTRLR